MRNVATVVSVVTRQFGSRSIYLFMLIRNSLASTVYSTPKTCHITPLLASLHWLKIKERIEYKRLSLTYNIFNARSMLSCSVCPSVCHVRGSRQNE